MDIDYADETTVSSYPYLALCVHDSCGWGRLCMNLTGFLGAEELAVQHGKSDPWHPAFAGRNPEYREG